MNIINACATYTGYEKEIKSLRFEIPNRGKGPAAPIFVLPSFAAQNTSITPGAFEEGSKVLIAGRLYHRLVEGKKDPKTGKIQKEVDPEDGRLYVIPTQELQISHPDCELNQVQLAGAVGWVGDLKPNPRGGGVVNIFLLCQAGKQKLLNHDWNDSVGFKIEAWGDDAKRFDKFVYKGRSIALGGALKFDCWTAKDGSRQGGYKVTVKSSQYSFFGKNQKTDVTTGAPAKVFDSPHQQAIAKPTVDIKGPANDGIPF